MVSAIIVKSVDLLDWGIQRLKSLLSSMSFEDTNLLSCMTLVEHFHSTSHVLPRLWKHCQGDYRAALFLLVLLLHQQKELVVSRAKHDIPLSALPSIPPPPDVHVKLSQKEISQMRDYALTYAAAVRQRTNRQETTMARHGPFCYISGPWHL